MKKEVAPKYKQIGNFIVTPYLLGYGLTSQVFLAYKEDINKEKTFFAAKTYEWELLEDVSRKQALDEEIKVLALLKNENIMKLVTTCETKNNFYLMLEYCSFRNLRRIF